MVRMRLGLLLMVLVVEMRDGVIDDEDIGVSEVVGDTVDASDCMSPIIPARAEVIVAGRPAVLDCASAPDASDCISPTIPARAEVIEAGNAIEPGCA